MKKENSIIDYINSWFPIKDKSFTLLIVIYLITAIIDFISTIRLGELVQYLESNPLYQYGGFFLIILVNILLIGIMFYLYKKGNINTRFIITFYLVAIIITRIIVIKQNLAIGANPPTLQQAMAVTPKMKTETIKRLLTVNILPFFNGIIAWLFFRNDHKIERKCKHK